MLKKLALINETILDCLNEKDDIKIVKTFTETGIKILGANFGFVWLKQLNNDKWTLVYKTRNLPFHPHKPRLTGINYKVMTTGKIRYIKKFKNTPSDSNAGKHIKSFMIIPISYKEKTYGTVVICFKKPESFSREKKVLSTFLGNGIAQVMTVHRSHERAEKLKEAHILLNQEKLKTEFIANTTHELRTPLAVIRGTVDMVFLENKINNKTFVENTLKNINKEVAHLSGILANLALLTSESGRTKNRIDYKPVNISKLIGELARRLRNVSREKDISIQTKIPRNIILAGDENYLTKLFSNLIRNAITYGRHKGWVKISMLVKKNTAEIIVSDNGIGIDKKDLPHIFDRFYRGDKAHSSDGKRTGLGLAIAKWVTDIHGGKISVSSSIGKGSTFTVILPIKNSRK